MRPECDQHVESQHRWRKHDRQSYDGFDQELPSPAREGDPVGDREPEEQQNEGDCERELQSQRNVCQSNVCQLMGMSAERGPFRAVSLLLARGRDDSVHPQILHHLAVVVISMRRNRSGQPQARNLSFAKWASLLFPSDLFSLIVAMALWTYAKESFRYLRMSALDVNGRRTRLVANIHGRLLF